MSWISFSAIFFLMALSTGCTSSKKGPSVNLAIWAAYLSPETLIRFEKKTGIQVNVSNYASNEELLAKLQTGSAGFDVVVPSDYMVRVMSKLGLLRELDHSKIPSAKSVDARFLKKPFDPENKVSIAYDWGTTGIAVNRGSYKGEIKGWNDLFTKPDLAGKIALLDDSREVISAALKALGFSLNSKNPDELEKAKQFLLRNRKQVKLFSGTPLTSMVNGEAIVSQNYSSNALQVRKRIKDRLDYILPVEGGTLWIDSLAIPSDAKNLDAAHALIDFLLQPETVAETVLAVWVSPTQKEALGLIPAEYRKDPGLFPSVKDLTKFEMFEDLGDAVSIWDRIWTEVKAGNG